MTNAHSSRAEALKTELAWDMPPLEARRTGDPSQAGSLLEQQQRKLHALTRFQQDLDCPNVALKTSMMPSTEQENPPAPKGKDNQHTPAHRDPGGGIITLDFPSRYSTCAR